jgi:hypothetical protein
MEDISILTKKTLGGLGSGKDESGSKSRCLELLRSAQVNKMTA